MKYNYFNLKNILEEKEDRLSEIKRQYHGLAIKYHPDRGGDEEAMKEINSEYDYLLKGYIDETDFKGIINSLMRFNDLEISVIGTWVWVKGNTFNIKEELKALGFLWSKSNKQWYKAPQNTKKRKVRKTSTEDEKKAKYGYTTYMTDSSKKICS